MGAQLFNTIKKTAKSFNKESSKTSEPQAITDLLNAIQTDLKNARSSNENIPPHQNTSISAILENAKELATIKKPKNRKAALLEIGNELNSLDEGIFRTTDWVHTKNPHIFGQKIIAPENFPPEAEIDIEWPEDSPQDQAHPTAA